MRRAVGVLIAVVVWVWLRTLRVSVEWRAAATADRARVFGFFHGEQMALLAVARLRPMSVLVSHSPDGEIQAGVMRTFGILPVRGSSSRGGVRGLVALCSALRAGRDAAFAVDGPRGPARVAKAGAAVAALAADAELLPVAAAAARAFVLRRAWDAFVIPVPFTRVSVVIGEPVAPRASRANPEILSRAIANAHARARALLAVPAFRDARARGSA